MHAFLAFFFANKMKDSLPTIGKCSVCTLISASLALTLARSFEDNLQNEDDMKNEDNLQNEDNLKK